MSYLIFLGLASASQVMISMAASEGRSDDDRRCATKSQSVVLSRSPLAWVVRHPGHHHSDTVSIGWPSSGVFGGPSSSQFGVGSVATANAAGVRINVLTTTVPFASQLAREWPSISASQFDLTVSRRRSRATTICRSRCTFSRVASAYYLSASLPRRMVRSCAFYRRTTQAQVERRRWRAK